jgi:ribosome-associated toxin RatA of RatAB toxin-antitoxin module
LALEQKPINTQTQTKASSWVLEIEVKIGAIAISTSFEAKLNSNSRLILQALSLSGVKVNARIGMQLKDGPFKQLNGAWTFTPLNDNACKISLELEFSFASKLVDIAIAPIFTE